MARASVIAGFTATSYVEAARRYGLDEYAIAALAAGGAPIDAYGVGTKMGVSADAPYLDPACKLVAYTAHSDDGGPGPLVRPGGTAPAG
jgi:nicotinic acid phosphoribosyltransferase